MSEPEGEIAKVADAAIKGMVAAIDKELIDAVEVFLELQKRRLGLIKKSKDKLA